MRKQEDVEEKLNAELEGVDEVDGDVPSVVDAAAEDDEDEAAAGETEEEEEGAREEEDPLIVANREAEAHKDRWMRLAAEFDNYKKRTSREMQLLAERQDPMRRLVQKLNLQEKALVRYVRLNYDNKFMPEKINQP